MPFAAMKSMIYRIGSGNDSPEPLSPQEQIGADIRLSEDYARSMEQEPPYSGPMASAVTFEPAQPLWQRAPTRLPDGRPVSDFMMLIPRLRHQPSHVIQNTLREIEKVLVHYRSVVLFADLNLKINTLWISVRPAPGICLELSAAVKLRVPEAVLVGQARPQKPWRRR